MNPYAVDLEPFFGKPVDEGTTAYAGAPLTPGVAAASEEAIIEALRTVHDPEIPVNIYELGLIYAINRQEDGNVHIMMTLTAPACPVAGEMPVQVANAVAAVEGVGEVEVELTWEPPWTTDRMSEDAKLALDIG
jgi:FeS assembly SUF system protein